MKTYTDSSINIFWILVFFYTDIGGFQKGFFDNNILGRINFSDIIFILISFVYLLFISKHGVKNYTAKRFIRIYLIWIFYFIFIYGMLNNTTSSTIFFFIKTRGFYMNLIILYFVSQVIQKGTIKFLRIFTVLSSIVFVLFIISLLTNYELIPILKAKRGIFSGTRIFLYNYSLMPMLIPISISVIFFKTRIKNINLLYLLGGSMFMTWILSLTRRQILYSLIHLIILYILSIKQSKRFFMKLLNVSKFLIIIFLLLLLLFPNYIEFEKDAIINTVSVVKTGETVSGKQDVRLSLTARKFIVDKISKHPMLGTGYDRRWYTSEGDKNGFEASDYVFISAIAMYGILGLMCFLPVYIFLYRNLFKIYKKYKKYGHKNVFYDDYDFILFFALFSIYLLYLLRYMDYFLHASSLTSSGSGVLFIEMGLLIGLFQKVFTKQKEIKYQI